jgi:hypothetical protein
MFFGALISKMTSIFSHHVRIFCKIDIYIFAKILVHYIVGKEFSRTILRGSTGIDYFT